jgi:hypothetical protein
VDSEIAGQFEVCPVIKRVSHGVRNGSGPRCELLKRGNIASAIALCDAVGPHGPPFVMITREPDFEKVAEASIFGNIPGREVRVVAKDGLGSGVFVVQPGGCF